MASYSYAAMQGWELTALFLVFLIITLVWDFLVGLLTFLNNIIRGRKANWLTRVKEELLALGVVSLVLLFVEPSLQQICIPDSNYEPDESSTPPPPAAPLPYGTYSCNDGYRQVFPRSVIHAAHYLLFYLAIVHILFSLLTSVITNIKLQHWSALERTARKEQNIPAVAVLRMNAMITRSDANQRLALRLREIWRDAIGFVDQDLYSLLRFMCEKRFRAHSVVLRNFNFLNMCEQCLEAELNEVYSHAWLLVFMMALLLLYNQVVYQIVWISGLCAALMALMSGNLRWVMKKTAREARNLWRQVQGMTDLESDDEEELPKGRRKGLDGGPQDDGTAIKPQSGGTSGDVEAGDVGLQQRLDQLPQEPPGGARSHVAKPPKQLRFAGPLGESVEPASWPEQGRRCRGGARMLRPCGQPGMEGQGKRESLVDWLEACRATRDGLASRTPPSNGGPAGTSTGSHLQHHQHVSYRQPKRGCRAKAGSLAASLSRAWQRQPRPPERQPPRPRETRERGGGTGLVVGRMQEFGLRNRRQPASAGPCAESTISNPLFSPDGAQFAVSGTQSYGCLGGTGGGSGMYGGSGGYNSMMGAAASGPQLAPSPSVHMPSSMMHVSAIGAAAASPYGGGGAPQVGQWGSNPSSGNPDEVEAGDFPASTGSGEGSTSSVEDGQQGRSAGHGKGHQPHDEDGEEDDVHSEKSMLEHALASGIEEKIMRLFFFGRPFLLLWIFNIIFAQASLVMTMSMAFVIPYDKFDSIRAVAMALYIWLPVVVTNLLLVFYGCWVFLPQYALLSVTGVLEPHEVMEEIKRSKTQDESEEGVAGFVLGKMTHYFIGHHDGETNLSTVFIVMLASQAGIILGKDYKAAKFLNKVVLKPMYKEFVMVWHDIAWYGELTSKYRVKTEEPIFEEAFKELDEDGSGALSFGELANMIRSLGTYATTGDVEAMLWEIDIDNSHSIGYDEFVKFLVYAFFDSKQLGYIDTPCLMDGMERLGMPINEMQAAVLMSVGNCEEGEEVKVTLRQFFGMYEKVVFDEEDSDEEEAASSQKVSILTKARDLLSTPNALFLGRTFSITTSHKEDSGSLHAAKSGLSSNSAAAGTSAADSTSSKLGVQGQGMDARVRQPSRLAVVSKP